MNLGLGTVQFGQPYGVSNTRGMPAPAEVREILAAARGDGCTVLDTAVAYGEAERVLGEVGVREWQVVSKLSLGDLRPGEDLARGLDRVLADSLARLRLPALYGLLVHRPADLAGAQADALVAWLHDARRRGYARKVGVSVYRAEQLEDLRGFVPELVQLPCSVFDQRASRGGHLAALRARGTEIHLRSIFLQGLLLMAPEDVPSTLPQAVEPVRRLRDWCGREGLTPLQAALAYAKGLGDAAVAVVGVTSLEEWRELGQAFHAADPARHDFSPLAVDDERLLNPGQWAPH